MSSSIHHVSSGRQQFSTQLKPVGVVKDTTSDMAVIARKGSQVLYKWRENRDKKKMQNQEKWWEVGTKSKQAQIVGDAQTKDAKNKGDHKENMETLDGSQIKREVTSDTEYDYKKSSQFGAAMREKNVAQSNFAKNMSIKEQRQYLPIFRVRDQLMQIVRDNQIVVMVGKTGSGKTTQLTQYLYEDGFADLEGSMIICTQPRRGMFCIFAW